MKKVLIILISLILLASSAYGCSSGSAKSTGAEHSVSEIAKLI